MTSDRYSVVDEAVDDVAQYVHGIRPNIGQFAQLLQVFFVGLTIGMQRTVVPLWPKPNSAYRPAHSHC